MHTNRALFCLAALLAGAGVAAAADKPAIPADAAAAMAQAMEALSKMQEKQGGAVDQKEMKALLPDKESIAGFKRTKVSAESNAAMGFRVNTATAEFQQLDDGGGSFSVKYQDLGGLNAFARAAMAVQDVDEETETGFRRTATYSGFKAEEEFDEADGNKHGTIKLIAGDRVSVEVSGSGVSFATLKAVIEKLDLKRLAALKPVAAPDAPPQPPQQPPQQPPPAK